MSKIVGIDLGTTNSLVATVEAGIPFVIADEDGRRLTPSVVHFPADGTEPVVGTKARRARVLQPERTVYSIKRFMGRRASEIEAEERNVAYRLSGEGAGPLQVDLPGRRVTPEEISAEILKKLKAAAEHALAEEVTRAVITVPAYFNDAQRNATKRAGELAGLTVERILNEPTAAALAYGLDRLHERAKIAVFDLGGGTFDLSILELHDGVFQVLATNGNTRLGGDDLDRRLVEFLGEVIRKEGGPDLASDPVARARVMEGAEEAKIKLSFETAVDLAFPFLTTDFSFHVRLERAAFEDLTRDLIERTRPHCLRALADAKLAPTDLDQVILVGGQTRMPLVRDFVGKLFQCVEFEATAGQIRLGQDYHRPAGPMLNLTQNPDEAVALGAAIQAEILSGGFKNLLLLDVTPLSLGLETFGGLMNVLIPRNSTIPIKAGEVFTTAVDGQKEMLIHVLQGEREKARDNWTLGRFSIEFETAPKGVPRVGVQFQIDADGILQVLARDIKTGRQRIVEMKSAVDVADADVQRMVEESVEHAFDDLAARRWVETKLRARETIQATRKGMAEYGKELPAETVEAIQAALKNLEELCELGDETVTNEMVARLKAGHIRLDEVTAPLAELMMDHAMEAMLKQRGLI